MGTVDPVLNQYCNKEEKKIKREKNNKEEFSFQEKHQRAPGMVWYVGKKHLCEWKGKRASTASAVDKH